jgi:stage II sporulation protein M
MQKDLEYLHSLKKYFIPVLVIFIFSLITGLFAATVYPEKSTSLIDWFKEIFGWITVLDPFERMIAIFKNNAIDSFLALVFGIGFGIVPVFIVAINGFFLGMVAFVFSKQTGLLFVLAAILPHGIIELPMVLLSAGIGLKLGHEVYMYFKGIRTNLKEEFKCGIWFFIRYIVPLLFIAAFIESYVTPVIALLFRT